MGIKLEFVIVFAIILIVGGAIMLKLDNQTSTQKHINKELEFKETTFIEVDTKKRQSNAFIQKGMRKNGILFLEHLTYNTNNISLLIADKAKYVKNILSLAGHIRVEEKEGYTYNTEYAKYNQKTEILTIPQEFTAKIAKNIIHGANLKYDAIKKEMHAKQIDAVVYTTEK